MGCRIGITTDEARRKSEWEKEYPALYGWKILHECRSREEAQKKENEFSKQYGCDASPGGADPTYSIVWYVYKFDF